jgi:hypothetical protein
MNKTPKEIGNPFMVKQISEKIRDTAKFASEDVNSEEKALSPHSALYSRTMEHSSGGSSSSKKPPLTNTWKPKHKPPQRFIDINDEIE